MQRVATGLILFFGFFSVPIIAGETLLEKVDAYYKKYSNVDLQNQGFKRDFVQLWSSLPRHTMNEKEISLKESLIHDFEIRVEFLKEPTKRDYPALIRGSLLTKNHAAHIHIYGYLMNNPSKENVAWVPFYSDFLTSCFIEKFDTASRLFIATELTKKYTEKESPWHKLSPWLRVVSTHYMMLEKQKGVSEQGIIQLIKDLGTIKPAKLNDASRSYGEKIAQDLCAWVHEDKKFKEKESWCESLLKAGWQAPLQHDVNEVNEKENGTFYLGKDIWEVAERNNDVLSAELCYLIGESRADAAQQYMDDASKEWRRDAYTWFLRAAEKGSIKGFERALRDGISGNKIETRLLECQHLLTERYPTDVKMIILNDLITLRCNIANRPSTQLKKADMEYLDWCVLFYDRCTQEITDPALLAQALCVKVYASALSAPLYGDTTISIPTLRDLKEAFSLLDIALHKDSGLFDPLTVMPQVVVDALHALLTNKTEIELTQREGAFVTVLLLEQASYQRFQHYTDLINAVYTIAGYKFSVPDPRAWCENLFKTDSHRLIFLASYNVENLAGYLTSATMLETMPLKPEEYSDSAVRAVQEIMTSMFRKSRLAKDLWRIGQEDNAEAGRRALHLLLHYELYETLDQGKKYAVRLSELQKKEKNVVGVQKAEECLKRLIKQDMDSKAMLVKSAIEQSYNDHFDQLQGGVDEIEEEKISSALKEKADTEPIIHALWAGIYTSKYNRTKDKVALTSGVIAHLEQARRLGLKSPETAWWNYVTPLAKELLWKEAQEQLGKQVPDYTMIAYAAYLNEHKTNAERKKMLEIGLHKHPFCSYVYVDCLLDENKCTLLKELPSDQRFTAYTALRYALMQGKRSTDEAKENDQVTYGCAEKILDSGTKIDDFGSTLVMASNLTKIGFKCMSVGTCPFKSKGNQLLFEVPCDKYIALAKDLVLLGDITTAANESTNSTIRCEAQRALFRLYFGKVYDLVNNGSQLDTKKINFIQSILSYGVATVKFAENNLILKKYLLSLTDQMIKKEPTNKAFSIIKTGIEKMKPEINQ